MIGQPVADFWPAGNRKALAEMIVAAANHAERDRASTRQLASDGILRDPVLSVWRSGSGEQADHIFATMKGTADDDRTYRSEEHTSELQSPMRISYTVFLL